MNDTARQDRIVGMFGLLAMIPALVFVYIYVHRGGGQGAILTKALLGGIVTLAIYSVLYRENPLYRFAEHVFIGLGVGYSLMIAWTEVLSQKLYDPVIHGGQWLWLWMLPLAAMAYLVFSRKHGWMSRVPLGILIGLSAGQIFQGFAQAYFPQIKNSFKPVVPNTMALQADPNTAVLSVSEALNNVVFVVTLLSVLVYFLFAFEQKNKGVRRFAQLGRWLIMIGFGAIFGSTVMTRFALLVDRMYFVLVEWLKLRT